MRRPGAVDRRCEARLPDLCAVEVQASLEIAGAVQSLRTAKLDEKKNKAIVDELQGKIAGFMADADTLMHGRAKLLTYKTIERSGYTVAPSSTRQFRLSSEKE